ncbi:MAG: ACP S-malonyltransferase [Alkalibacterium sp.]|nr:ACP S-malonyltransferase [Alkalibacterium sp.]
MKTGFVFSGQGAQYMGMGKDFYDSYAAVRETFEEASDAIGHDLVKICFEDENAIHFTPYTQPAILTVSHAIEKVALEEGLHSDMLAGLSLGEYTALVSGEALSFSDAVKLVHTRGTLMENAVPDGQGKMAAVIGLEASVVEELCEKVSKSHYVALANYNTPNQLVVSGSAAGVDRVADLAAKAEAKKVVELKVSGPFHSLLLKPAAEEFAQHLKSVEFSAMKKPVYSNVTAQQYPDSSAIPDLLTKQMVSSVRFEQMIRQMIADGAESFIEIGPGKTLKSFIKAIDRSVQPKNIEKPQQLLKLLNR